MSTSYMTIRRCLTIIQHHELPVHVKPSEAIRRLRTEASAKGLEVVRKAKELQKPAATMQNTSVLVSGRRSTSRYISIQLRMYT